MSDGRPQPGRAGAPRSHRRPRRPSRREILVARVVAALIALVVLAGLVAGVIWLAGVLFPAKPSTGAAAPPANSGETPVYSQVATAAVASIDPAAFQRNLSAIAGMAGRPTDTGDGIKVGSFLGGDTRRFYGIGPVPAKLDVIWKVAIGSGKTSGTASSKGAVNWSGTGWTGQPTLIRDKGRLYVLIGGYDHGLRKIDAETGKVVWRYAFDDVIKGTNTVFINPKPTGEDDRVIVVSGSRRGFGLSMSSPDVAPVRAISFATGKELWRLPAPHTKAYSRDADASPLLIDGWLYAAVESGYLYKLDPNRTTAWGKYRKPVIEKQVLLYEPGDSKTHGGNLCLEGSPTLVGDRIFISTSAGHFYGVTKDGLDKVWDFKTGSDIDSTLALTKDGFLVGGVEKQYIKGKGGAVMLDPSKKPADAVVWYFPTGDRKFGDWLGGIIGSVSVNDEYDPGGTRPKLAAFNAIDGNMYLVSRDDLAAGKVKGWDAKTEYRAPVLVYKHYIGGAISTPIIVDDHIVCAGYDAKVHVFKMEYSDAGDGPAVTARNGKKVHVKVTELDTFSAGGFESTPVVWNGRVYIGSRNGYFYCLGEK